MVKGIPPHACRHAVGASYIMDVIYENKGRAWMVKIGRKRIWEVERGGNEGGRKEKKGLKR
jgi:hypothetical protein